MIAEVLQLLQCLAAEHIALHEWRKNAENHFRDGDMLDIGDGHTLINMHLSCIPFICAVLCLYICFVPMLHQLRNLLMCKECVCVSSCVVTAGPFRKKPSWTDINRIDAEALLEFGEKVLSLDKPCDYPRALTLYL